MNRKTQQQQNPAAAMRALNENMSRHKKEEFDKVEEAKRGLAKAMEEINKLNQSITTTKTATATATAAPPIGAAQKGEKVLNEKDLNAWKDQAKVISSTISDLKNVGLELQSTFSDSFLAAITNTTTANTAGSKGSSVSHAKQSLDGIFSQARRKQVNDLALSKSRWHMLRPIQTTIPTTATATEGKTAPVAAFVRNGEWTCMDVPYMAGSRVQQNGTTFKTSRHISLTQFAAQTATPTLIAHLTVAPPLPEMHALPLAIAHNSKHCYVLLNIVPTDPQNQVPTQIAVMKVALDTFQLDTTFAQQGFSFLGTPKMQASNHVNDPLNSRLYVLVRNSADMTYKVLVLSTLSGFPDSTVGPTRDGWIPLTPPASATLHNIESITLSTDATRSLRWATRPRSHQTNIRARKHGFYLPFLLLVGPPLQRYPPLLHMR